MPLRCLTQCKSIGCRELTRLTYCPEHIHIIDDMKAERNKQYDNNRDNKYTEFYHSGAWGKVRAIVLTRDHGLCVHCYNKGIITTADMVHHIQPVRANWLLRLVLINLVSLCNSCHSNVDHKG